MSGSERLNESTEFFSVFCFFLHFWSFVHFLSSEFLFFLVLWVIIHLPLLNNYNNGYCFSAVSFLFLFFINLVKSDFCAPVSALWQVRALWTIPVFSISSI